MKKLLYVVVFILLLSSCGSNEVDTESALGETKSTTALDAKDSRYEAFDTKFSEENAKNVTYENFLKMSLREHGADEISEILGLRPDVTKREDGTIEYLFRGDFGGAILIIEKNNVPFILGQRRLSNASTTLTLDKFEQLELGMRLQDFNRIMGVDGILELTYIDSLGNHMYSYLWTEVAYSNKPDHSISVGVDEKGIVRTIISPYHGMISLDG